MSMRHPDRRHEGGGGLLDQVEVLGAVHHDHGRLLRVLGGDPREPRQAGAIGRGPGDDEVPQARAPRARGSQGGSRSAPPGSRDRGRAGARAPGASGSTGWRCGSACRGSGAACRRRWPRPRPGPGRRRAPACRRRPPRSARMPPSASAGGGASACRSPRPAGSPRRPVAAWAWASLAWSAFRSSLQSCRVVASATVAPGEVAERLKALAC